MNFVRNTNMILWLSIFLLSHNVFGQFKEKINWINFNQLNDSLKIKPKKVFIDFYAEWCAICKKMDETTFKDEKIVELLNKEYYAVKMNVETLDTINFGGQTFVNKRYKRVNPIHEIPLLMASRKNEPFSLPVYVLQDENFEAKARYFQFIDAGTLFNILSKDK